MTDIAILHDQLTEHGGAEHVAFELARTFDAPVYAAKVDDGIVPEDVDAVEVLDSGVTGRCMESHHVVQDIGQMFGWQYVEDLFDYETILVNKNNPGWYPPRDHQTVVKYCHTTPRGLFDLFHRHGEPTNLSNPALKPFRKALEPLLTGVNWGMKTAMRVLFGHTTRYPDVWVCNSDLTERRVDLYLDKNDDNGNVKVVYPPVHTDEFDPGLAETQDYYFTFSRLVPDKRVDDIVQAFEAMPHRQLVVGGDGPERERLEGIAPDNVKFIGYMSESEKRARLSEARAFLFAAENEDFGMVPVEAFASGTPVIGVEDGFTQHQIVDGRNGYTFPRGKLADTVRYHDSHPADWSAGRIAEFADRFSASQFRARMREIVAETREDTAIDPDWARDSEEDTATGRGVAIADGGGR